MGAYQRSCFGVDVSTIVGFMLSTLICNYIFTFSNISIGNWKWFIIIVLGTIIAITIRSKLNTH